MAFAGTTKGLELVTHVVRGRWFTIFASFLIMSAAGATYIFGIYSKDIKSSLGYNQQTLNTLGFFKDLGANVGILSGLINEVTPPWVVLAMGAAMNLAGYLMIYLSITSRVLDPRVWQMCLYICVGANSQAFANTGSLVTCVKNFPESRGVVLGLGGGVGCSGRREQLWAEGKVRGWGAAPGRGGGGGLGGGAGGRRCGAGEGRGCEELGAEREEEEEEDGKRRKKKRFGKRRKK